jgi:hypothetical protein
VQLVLVGSQVEVVLYTVRVQLISRRLGLPFRCSATQTHASRASASTMGVKMFLPFVIRFRSGR